MANDYTLKEKGIIRADATKIYPSIDAMYGPWESIAAFRTYLGEILGGTVTDDIIPNSVEIGIIQSDGTVKRYEWKKPTSGQGSWVESSGAVISVNGKIGAVVLDKTDIGLGNVDNTADANKVVKRATEDGSGNVITSTYETKADAATKQAEIDALESVVNNLTGLDGTNFGGYSVDATEQTAIDAIATMYTSDGHVAPELYWYLAGTSMTALKAYRYNGSGTPVLISSNVYDFTDFSGVSAQVQQLESDIADLGLETSQIKVDVKNVLVDTTKYVAHDGSIGPNGTWGSTSTTKHIAIPIHGGIYIRMSAAVGHAVTYSILSDYSVPVSGDTPEYANGYSGRVSGNGVVTVQAPNDANYLYLLTQATDGDDVTPSEILLQGSMDGGLYERMSAVQTNVQKATLIYTESDADELLSTTDAHRGYAIKSDGDLYAANFMCLAFRNDKGCSSIVAHLGSLKSNNAYYVIGYYSSDTPSAESFIGGIEANEVQGDYIYSGDIPSNAVLIVVSNRNATFSPELASVKLYSSCKTIVTLVEKKFGEIDSVLPSITNLADDIEYIGTTNLLNPANFIDGYKINYSGANIGQKSESAASACTNTLIPLDPTIGVSIQTKTFGTLAHNMNFDVFFYDSEGEYIDDSYMTVAVGSGKSYFLHANSGASYMMFALRYWTTNYGTGTLPTNIMVWQSDSSAKEQWVDYGAKRRYKLKSLSVDSSPARRIDQYDGQVMNIAYSSLVAGYPINTVEHFINAISLGYNCIKGDMRLTSDNEIVLCHDAGFTLDGNGRITTFDSDNCTLIRNMTLAQVLALEHSSVSAYNRFGYYPHPCTLDDMLLLCKEYDIIPYITFRAEYIEQTAPLLVAKLQKYGLISRAIINLYNALDCVLPLKSLDDTLILCYTFDLYSKTSTDLRVQIDTAAANGCSIACMRSTDIDTQDTTYDDDCAAYAVSNGVRLYAWGVNTYESYYRYISKGLVGFQITANIGLKCLTPAALTMQMQS